MVTPDDNVVVMPLPSRSERIAALLKREAANHDDWVEIQLGLVREISEARKSFKDDVQFGHWFKACGFDERINRNERAAYVSMARDPLIAKRIFDATRRESIPRIERLEFRPQYDAKVSPGGETKKKKRGRPPRPKQLEAALAAIATMEAAGIEITEEGVAMAAGVGAGTANKAIALHRARHKPDPPAGLTGFSSKGKLTIDKAIAVHKRRLDKAYEARVNAEVRARIDTANDHVRAALKAARAQIAGLERMLHGKGVFTRAEFRQLQMAVHPDNTASAEVRNHLLDLLVKNEARLVKEA